MRALSTLAKQLESSISSLILINLPNRGRGLVAAKDIPQGTVVHEELPMLATPAAINIDNDCNECLQPQHSGGAGSKATHTPFCSAQCQEHASIRWWEVAQKCDFSSLRKACAASNEKFPLLLSQYACILIQRQLHDNYYDHIDAQKQSSNNTETSTNPPVMRGDPVQEMKHLCFANVPEPPKEWAEMHALLVQGLLPLIDQYPKLKDVLNTLDFQWFCNVLSRLHLNVFRVDTMPLFDLMMNREAFLRAAVGDNQHSSNGSAVYLLASMFNHSCDPNVDITFPRNNSFIRFTAATDINKHEELLISYIDTTLPVVERQNLLHFAYGFKCDCVRCQEESGRGGF